MADILSTLSIVSFILSGIAFVVAVLCFILFRIPSVIGDLSGRTARKSIAKMRAANEKNGVKAYKSSQTNIERGKLTEAVPESGKFDPKKPVSATGQPETGLLADNTANGFETEATGMLEEATVPLDFEATGLLIPEEETVPLVSIQGQAFRPGGKAIEMLEEIVFIHTDEVI